MSKLPRDNIPLTCLRFVCIFVSRSVPGRCLAWSVTRSPSGCMAERDIASVCARSAGTISCFRMFCLEGSSIACSRLSFASHMRSTAV